MNSDRLLKGVSILCYLVSLELPVFSGSYVGLLGLLTGWMAFKTFYLPIALPWLANCTYWLAVILNRRFPKLKVVLSILTIVLASGMLYVDQVPHLGNTPPEEVSLGSGAMFWSMSFVLILISNLWEWGRKES